MLWLNLLTILISNLILKTKCDTKIFDSDTGHVFNEIVGGTPTEPLNYPYIVTIQINGYHYCGGSILRIEHPAMVITAAHCSQILNPNKTVIVRLYAQDADAPFHPDTNNYIDARITNAVVHPDYVPFPKENDIMILYLEQDVRRKGKKNRRPLATFTFLQTVTIEPNTIPSTTEGNLECCIHDQDLQVIGYGNDCYRCDYTPTLEYVDVSYISRSQCFEFFGPELTETMNCAAELPKGGADACHGDSGGPLIIKGTNRQIGIVSYGYGCAWPDHPAVYTDVGVPEVYNWIQEQMIRGWLGWN